MKRHALVFVLLLCGIGAFAQDVNENKQDILPDKIVTKEVKKKTREWMNEGWQPYNTTKNMKEVVRDIIIRGLEDGKRSVVGTADSVVDLEKGIQAAFSNAVRDALMEYHSLHHETRVITQFDDSVEGVSLNFESNEMVETEREVVTLANGDSVMMEITYRTDSRLFGCIQAELREGYIHTLYRKSNNINGDKTFYEMRSFFTIDFEALTDAIKEDSINQLVETIESYRKAAESGDAIAQYNMGQAYRLGRGVKQDFSEAAKWYNLAAEQGNANAQFLLGKLYATGNGVEQDTVKAVKWYGMSADQGVRNAQYIMGEIYYEGIGVSINEFEAAKWYRKSAEQGYMPAQVKLALMYEYGVGVDRDYSEAVKWYRSAAEQGNVQALEKAEQLESKMERTNKDTPK